MEGIPDHTCSHADYIQGSPEAALAWPKWGIMFLELKLNWTIILELKFANGR